MGQHLHPTIIASLLDEDLMIYSTTVGAWINISRADFIAALNIPAPPVGDDPITVKAAGSVASDGTAEEIINATVVRVSQGRYDITFATASPTATYPVLATMQGLPQNDDYQWAYLNRTVNGFRIEIREQDNGTAAGNLRDSGFSFQALTLGN